MLINVEFDQHLKQINNWYIKESIIISWIDYRPNELLPRHDLTLKEKKYYDNKIKNFKSFKMTYLIISYRNS